MSVISVGGEWRISSSFLSRVQYFLPFWGSFLVVFWGGMKTWEDDERVKSANEVRFDPWIRGVAIFVFLLFVGYRSLLLFFGGGGIVTER